RRDQEVLVLQRIALRTKHQRGIVEHVLSDGRPDEEADVELAPIHLAVQAEREIRVGVADDRIVVGGRAQRLPIDTSRAGCDTGEHLLSRRVHAEKARSEERADRDRKSTRLNSSHGSISYAVFCLKKK